MFPYMMPTTEQSADRSGEPDEESEEVCVEYSNLINHASHHLVHCNKSIDGSLLCATSYPSLPCMTLNYMVPVAGAEIFMEQLCVCYVITCKERYNVKLRKNSWLHAKEGLQEEMRGGRRDAGGGQNFLSGKGFRA